MLVALLSTACYAGPSRDQVRRSQAEYESAIGLFHQGHRAAAYQHLQTAIELDPDNAEAHFLLGNFFTFRGNAEEAERHFREALRAHASLGTASRPSLPSEVKNSLGVLYIHERRLEDAIRELSASAGDLLNRTPFLAWGNLAWAYLEAQRADDALDAARQAVELQPDFCIGWFRVGQALRAKGNLEEAEAALGRAVDVEDPTCQANQPAWRLRGEVLALMSRPEEAVEALERCVTLGDRTEDGDRCRRLLDSAATRDPEESPGEDSAAPPEAQESSRADASS
ncbi:MAG: tetratricopeptide repeat protein [Sandaracinaceae bacterium]